MVWTILSAMSSMLRLQTTLPFSILVPILDINEKIIVGERRGPRQVFALLSMTRHFPYLSRPACLVLGTIHKFDVVLVAVVVICEDSDVYAGSLALHTILEPPMSIPTGFALGVLLAAGFEFIDAWIVLSGGRFTSTCTTSIPMSPLMGTGQPLQQVCPHPEGVFRGPSSPLQLGTKFFMLYLDCERRTYLTQSSCHFELLLPNRSLDSSVKFRTRKASSDGWP